MNIKISSESDIENVINEIKGYDTLTLYKSIKNKKGYYSKLKLGYYTFDDGLNNIDVLCDKNLVAYFKNAMNKSGYDFKRK